MMVTHRTRITQPPAATAAEQECPMGLLGRAVRQVPTAALLCGFGAGMALGCLAVHAARRTRQQQETDALVRLRTAILETIERIAPESVTKRVADSMRAASMR